MDARGWVVVDNVLDQDQVVELNQVVQLFLKHNLFSKAGIGKAVQKIADIRNDSICWIAPLSEKEIAVQREIASEKWTALEKTLAQLEQLRLFLNREFFLGLKDFEAHFAIYPPGGKYEKHLDQFQKDGARKISFVLYLNQEWKDLWGGRLKIYPSTTGVSGVPANFEQKPIYNIGINSHADTENQSQVISSVSPQPGRLVLFRSEKIPHEVEECRSERLSLTGWFRT